MKSKICLFFVLVMISCLFSAFAHTGQASDLQNSNGIRDVLQQARVYIDSTQMHPTPEGVFVEIKGDLYQVAEICQDENGYFVPYTAF